MRHLNNPLKKTTHKKKFNLHGHSTESDGEASPFEIQRIAELIKRYLGITDHNTAKAHTYITSPYIIPGIEVTTSSGPTGVDVLLYNTREKILEFDENEIQPRTHRTHPTEEPVDIRIRELLEIAEEHGMHIVMPHYALEGGLGELPVTEQRIIAEQHQFAVELNGQCSRVQNKEARMFAKLTDKPLIASQDAHRTKEWMGAYTKLRIPRKTHPTVDEIFQHIEARKRIKMSVQEPNWTEWKDTALHLLKRYGVNKSIRMIRAKASHILRSPERLSPLGHSLHEFSE